MLVVDSVDIDPNPTTFDRYSWFNVTVENAGPETANQHVRVRNEYGETIASEFVRSAQARAKPSVSKATSPTRDSISDITPSP